MSRQLLFLLRFGWFFTYMFIILIAAPRKKKKTSIEAVDKATTSTSLPKEESMEADVVSMISIDW